VHTCLNSQMSERLGIFIKSLKETEIAIWVCCSSHTPQRRSNLWMSRRKTQEFPKRLPQFWCFRTSVWEYGYVNVRVRNSWDTQSFPSFEVSRRIWMKYEFCVKKDSGNGRDLIKRIALVGLCSFHLPLIRWHEVPFFFLKSIIWSDQFIEKLYFYIISFEA